MKKILIVDDDPVYAKMLKILLEKNGYAVCSAEDGETGLRTARKEKPDLIVLDILMPKIDGTEVYSLLKNDDELAEIPVLFLTAILSKEDEKPGVNIEESFYHVLAKPIDNQEFLKQIKAIVG